MFTVSLAEWATPCYEDSVTNRTLESLQLFDEIVNSPFFENVPFVLLLGKADILPKLASTVSFSSMFPEYTGSDDNYLNMAVFLKDMFLKQYKGQEKDKVLPIIISSIDKDMVEEAQKIIVDVIRHGVKRHSFTVLYKLGSSKTLFQAKSKSYLDVDIVVASTSV